MGRVVHRIMEMFYCNIFGHSIIFIGYEDADIGRIKTKLPFYKCTNCLKQIKKNEGKK